MRIEGEIVLGELFGGLGVGGIVQQNRAQDGLFGKDIRRQAGIARQVGDRGHIQRV